MANYHVYIIQSVKDPHRFYMGLTEDLDSRIKEHNRGKCKNTSKYTPLKIKTYIAFTDKQKARDFEKYLKTSSGRAFAKKRF